MSTHRPLLQALAIAWLGAALTFDLLADEGGLDLLLYLPAVLLTAWAHAPGTRSYWLIGVLGTVAILAGAAPDDWRSPVVVASRGAALLALWGMVALILSRAFAQREIVDARPQMQRLFGDNEALRQQVQASHHELAERQERAEAALRDSEALYHSLVEHLPLSVLRKDANFRYTFVNRQFLEFSGKRADEILGKTDFDVFPEALARKYREGDEEVCATGRLFDDVESFPRPNGEMRFIQVLKGPVRDAQQRIVGTQVIVWDVTDRQRAEDAMGKFAHELEQRNLALQRSEDQLRRQTRIFESVLESIADGVIVADEQGRFLIWNPAAERIVGLGPTEQPREAWSSAYGVYELDRTTPYPPDRLPLARAIRGEAVTDEELFIRNERKPQGAFLRISGTPLADAAGELRGGVIVVRDVTRRRAADEALRHSEEQARRIVETAYDPFVAIDSGGRVVDWNRQAETTFGWSRAEAIGKLLAELIVPPPQREAHRLGLARFLETGEGPLLNRRVEATALHRDGREFPVELTIWPLRSPQGCQFQAFVHDITERKAAEAEIRSKNQDLETLLYVTSHDLREPLRAIENFARIVHDRYAAAIDEKGRDFLSRVVAGAQRMDRLIEDVLTLSRVQRTAQPDVDVDATEIVDDVLKRLEPRIRETQATVRVIAPLPSLRADRRWATQAVQNLVSNALKYTLDGVPPDVEIAGYSGPEGPGLVVRDRGMGVPAELTERIFGLFQRGVGRMIEGTGAGLAIVKRVAERHGGRTWVRSREGGGSEFIITFGNGTAP